MNSLVLGCLFAFLAVVTGAFGAHGLKNTLDAYGLEIWHTAAQYQMVHALALLALGLFEAQTGKAQRPARLLFLAGIFLFSGSLYALALSGVKALGAITPFGGLSFMIGWLAFARAAWRAKTTT